MVFNPRAGTDEALEIGSSGSGEEDFRRVFTIYGHGGHLGHVTCIIYIYIGSLFQ